MQTIMSCDERLLENDEDRGASNRLLPIKDKNEEELKQIEEENQPSES